MSEAHKPVGVIFDAAIELPADQRTAYLQEACGGDAPLRQRVEALLRAHELAGTFMDGPAVASGRETVVVRSTEQVGTRIGRYKLLQQIGEGGCGVVYMAEQEEPVKRRVALKVIKLGMDTKSVIARFEAERQALALMDHPNIAKVLDAGATETGRPYFVMELVRGIRITDYCDENNLSTAARLGLFVQVCQAIQHAHQKGIIHRDIKPSNVLVADHDGVPVPKIIDFGIAKATTDQRLTDKTLFTAFEQFIGTPAYMSPEQARLSGLDIDTRSDIYSLGVLLYELLTGNTPFEAKRLLDMGLDEIRRVIREEEPARPSTKLHTLDAAEQTTVARHRQSDPPKLMHLISGDLDWIVMKALEKDRTRRYETANGLAADIQRHLGNEPVVACPPDNFYKFQKLVRRNKLVFIATSAVVGSLIIGLGASTWFLLRERQALREAATAHANEAILEEKLKESVRQYADVQTKVREQQPGEDPAVVQRRTYDELAKQLGIDPKVLQDKLPQFARELKSAPDTPPYERANAAYFTKDYTEAVKWYRIAAGAGNAAAMDHLAWMYEQGLGVEKSITEAAKWYRKAAEAGDPHGEDAIAFCYESGRGVETNYTEALKWYRIAADAGNAASMGHLAAMHEQGVGVEKDDIEAVKWHRKAADAGNSWAQDVLAYRYDRGLGVKFDYTEAVKWYLKAAEAGNTHAQNALAYHYECGLGVTQDYAEATKWYRMAAEAGDNGGRNNLGRMCEKGLGVVKDITEAARWYRMAAEAGDADGKRNLARILAPNSTSKAGNDEVLEIVNVDNVPLSDAIRQMAIQAGVNIEFDPALLGQKAPDGTPILSSHVTERGKDVTARQALQALLDNYGWQMKQFPGTPIFRIVAKSPESPRAAPVAAPPPPK